MADIIPFNKKEREAQKQKEREARKQKEQANEMTLLVKMMFTPDGFGVVAEKLTSAQISPEGIIYFIFGEAGPLCALDIGNYGDAWDSALELQEELYKTFKIKIKVC